MKLLQFVIAGALLVPAVAHADNAAKQAKKERVEMQKERKEQRKMNEKELNQKATKEARKEAKRLKKEGWTVAPGMLPLDKQLDRTLLMQYQYSDVNTPVYIMGEAMSVGGNYDSAKLQAMELAKFNIISQLQSDISTMVENTVGNDQLNDNEAASVARMVMASKNVMTRKLGRLMPVLEIYRNTDKGTKEVMVRVAYNLDMAKKVALEAVSDDLRAKGDSLHLKLDALLQNH